jgi:hypothetical protein
MDGKAKASRRGGRAVAVRALAQALVRALVRALIWGMVGGALASTAVCASARGAVGGGGAYHVYSCRMPNGAAAPVDGWSESSSQANDHTADTCASEGGGLVAALEAGHSHPADTDLATWAFEAPAGETLAAATLWRAGDTAGGANENASYLFWFAGAPASESGSHVFERCAALNECSRKGILTTPLAMENRIEVPESALHTRNLSLTASCGSAITGYGCPAGGGDENGNAAVVELFAADLVLTQETSPTVQEVKGPLAEAATISGSSDIAFSAADSGSGVYEAIFAVDGKTVANSVLDANGGRCHDVGQTSDGLPAFLYTQPCPASLSVDVPFDTTALSNGSHHLVVSVSDAAGNATPVVNREVTVANSSPSDSEGSQPGSGGPGSGAGSGPGGVVGGNAGTGNPSGTPPQGGGANNSSANTNATTAAASAQTRGAANGSEASDAAVLSARWQGSSPTSARLQSVYGRAHTVTGALTAPGGHPIAGASVEATVQPLAAGAHATALTAVRTDAQGRFSLTLARTSSSTTLRLAYRSHINDPLPVATRTLTLAVSPTLTLHIAPQVTKQGRTVRFSGSLAGGYIPPGGKQLVLEGRSPGAPWTEFDVVRSNAAGAFHAIHRFRLPGPVAYSFRVLSGYEADYPFLAGSSNVVGVLER